jgi:hypothetical protein
MGQLLYGSTPTVIELDDRILAHVELVTLAKFRRNESFALVIEASDGSRSTLWLSSTSNLEFRLTVGRHEINREWLDLLIDTANSTGGMRLLPEPVSGKAKGDSPQ